MPVSLSINNPPLSKVGFLEVIYTNKNSDEKENKFLDQDQILGTQRS
jgi:hypothetical protein